MWEKRDHCHYHCDVFFCENGGATSGVASDVIYSLIDVMRCQECCWCPSVPLCYWHSSGCQRPKQVALWRPVCSWRPGLIVTSCVHDADIWEAFHVQRCGWRTSKILLFLMSCKAVDMLVMAHILPTSCCALAIWEAIRSAVLIMSKAMLWWFH